MSQDIDTGDAVLHQPTGETWLVARVDGSHLYWMGWPPGCASLADCVLLDKASTQWRDKTLSDIANSGHVCADWARERLAAMAPANVEGGGRNG